MGPFDFDVCVVAAGFTASHNLANTDLPTGSGGRILVDPHLRSIADPTIYAAGDAALPVEPCGAPPRMSAFFALATGAFVASAIADEMAGRRQRRFGFWTYGQAIGLGGDAVGFASFPHDRPVGPLYTGRIGYWLRHFFVWVLFQLLRLEMRRPGLPFYLGQSLRRTRAQ
jgi:NADH dehydrogenase FAD-containing subunit